MESEQPLLVLGTHAFAPEVLDLVSETPGFRVDGFVENLDRTRAEDDLEGLPLYWIDDVDRFAATHRAVCALGTTERRRIIEEAAARGLGFATVVHPAARVSSRSELGEGTLASARVVVAANARVGRHVILNRGALVGHDTATGDYVTVGPGAKAAGPSSPAGRRSTTQALAVRPSRSRRATTRSRPRRTRAS